MNWKKYEKEILTYFQETFPDTTISFDKTIVGKYSKVDRQIDILIEGEVAGYEIKIIVDCKNFSKNIDVKQVESFCSMVEDVDVHQGVLITQKGFSKAAINRVYYGNNKVELDIINFEDLKEFQNTAALPYSRHFAVIIPAPFGWVFDLKDKINSFASIHQRGLTLKKAQRKNEWMYMQYWKIENTDFDIDNLIQIQNKNILGVDPNSKFTYNSLVKRTDGLKTKIRIAEVKAYPALEVTGFIQFEEYILFIVLFTPKELLNKNLRKLQYLLKVATLCQLTFDNHTVIKQQLDELNDTTDKQKQAEMYFQVGIWFQEMDDFDNALINFKKSIDSFPTHYSHLKAIIQKTLSFGFIQEAKLYAMQLFTIDPTNPKVSQDLIDIYFENKRPELLIEIFNELIDENKNIEVLGNLNFHLGFVYFSMENKTEGALFMTIARHHFEKVFPKDHYIFKAMKEFEQPKSSA